MSDVLFVVLLLVFIWLVLDYIDNDWGGGKRARVPS